MTKFTVRIKIIISLLCLGLAYKAISQNIGINTTGANPSAHAILDLNTGNANNVGLLIPNVSLTALGTFNPPMTSAATGADKGLMVYNTNAVVGSGIGYYYWNGATWVSVSGGAATVTAANNGLTLAGTTVQLGGANPLLGNTNIVSGGFNLAFTGTGNFQLGSAFGSTGELDFFNAASNKTVAFSAGNTVTSYTLTLPTAQGAANTVLTDNGFGTLSWNNPAVAGAVNGLTMNGTNVELGGANPLLGNTSIISNGNNLAFTGNGIFQLGQAFNSTGTLQFLNVGGNKTVGISAGNTTTSYNLTLPLAQGAAGTVLTNNGAGVLSWAAAAGAAANNGLTIVGGNVQLGGANALLANTNIVSGGFNLAFTGTGNFQLGQASNSTGELDFLNAGSANLVGISAGATTASYNLTLPLAQGAANTVLTNNGAGVLTWSAVAGGGSANNGLTVVGGNTQLGGANPLLANTSIASGGFNLSFTGTGKFQLGAPSSSTGELDFYNSGSALGVGITAGATTSTYTLTLPTTPPASPGQVLASTVGGTMSWSTIPAGGPGILIGILYVTSTTGTVNFAAGTTAILVRAIGGGGAGGGVKYGGGCSSNPDMVGGGGGAGGYCEGFVSGLAGANYQINIGAGGIGVATCSPTATASGGNTVVKVNGVTVFTANGGAVGPTYESGAAGAFTGGAGGTAAGGSLNITGSTGGWCSTSTTGTDGDFAGCGGNSSFGSGGSSVYTRDHIRINGVAASAPGAGGGGAVIAQSSSAADVATGGNGAAGVVIIYEYQ